MTVRELINMLEQIQNKEIPVYLMETDTKGIDMIRSPRVSYIKEYKYVGIK